MKNFPHINVSITILIVEETEIYVPPSSLSKVEDGPKASTPLHWISRQMGRAAEAASGRGDLCVWGRDARHAAFPTWGVMRRKQTRPRWWRDAILVCEVLPETFTIHSTYLTETRPSADKSCAPARRTYSDAMPAAYINSRQSAEFRCRVSHGFSPVPASSAPPWEWKRLPILMTVFPEKQNISVSYIVTRN